MNEKRVLLMDEVDGMAGNEDMGGLIEESFIFGRYFVARTYMCVGEQERVLLMDGMAGNEDMGGLIEE